MQIARAEWDLSYGHLTSKLKDSKQHPLTGWQPYVIKDTCQACMGFQLVRFCWIGARRLGLVNVKKKGLIIIESCQTKFCNMTLKRHFFGWF